MNPSFVCKISSFNEFKKTIYATNRLNSKSLELYSLTRVMQSLPPMELQLFVTNLINGSGFMVHTIKKCKSATPSVRHNGQYHESRNWYTVNVSLRSWQLC